MLEQHFRDLLGASPLIAILRGVKPDEVLSIADVLLEEGIRLIEVPLNSPDALTSIKRLRAHMEGQGLCGAGTVLTTDEVTAVQQAGGQLIVSPNCDTDVIRATLESGMLSLPGCFSPTDAFSAIKAGTPFLKLFPVGTLGAGYVSALHAVLPKSVTTIAVGGVSAAELPDYWAAGVRGFGLASNLYRPGDTAGAVASRARELVHGAAALG